MASPPNEQEGQQDGSSDPNTWTTKICNDPIHGHIELNEACVAIIDTPQFQRLRFIKQLGFCYYVYPGASHNRFEHSIGVYHLAGEMVRSLKSNQPELKISKKDILCVELAGLCHDLGHGPHSHMFDGKFMPEVEEEMKWTHEKGSLDMFDHMIKENGLRKAGGVLHEKDLEEKDIIFIKELFYGPLSQNEDNEGWPYKGREKSKSFLYEIISNKETGIDVDKWDYFARDCYHLGQTNNFDHKRFIKFVRVLKVGEKYRICARDKEQANLYQMFHTRYNLHRSAYQHKVNYAIELMVVDALVKANDFIKFQGERELLKLSKTVHDPKAYEQVTDNILWQIYISQEKELQSAKDILTRIFQRDLYVCLDEMIVSSSFQNDLDDEELSKLEKNIIHRSSSNIKPIQSEDFKLQVVKMDYGMKDNDPLKDMWFYKKNNVNKPIQIKESSLNKPRKFTDNRIRIYSRVNDQATRQAIRDIFNLFREHYEMPPSAHGTPGETSPSTNNVFLRAI